mmetsp:Transcript_26535/g.44295  ORF Transcript_26535/g.44295 Transcript_26535/m.44295 type:complete len:177 (+) Transcript_26535:154-684(+)|eukprot:CAMPEP_0119006182 /NCGR_PEP_ID=MMETSP1176-20130426/2155_1 /TAXON_ID=265551 /ORGANISM="Synedropsis recta cf, Strain CCMP1620" /LENGTH=176 /DNA_ID=CAMNT_0006958071 /DNA_START=144 /DNA_END=674 /DNA_ORIENTATION=+
MQFRVTIPAHVKAGQVIRIRCPDGTEGDVKVPKGLRSGDSFVFEMPETGFSNNSNSGKTGNNGDSSKDDSGKNGSAAPSSTVEIRGFLDREIVNMQDFAMALGVGLLIGLSIVAGFLLGILHVTDNTTGHHQQQAAQQHQQQVLLMQQQQQQQQPQMRMPNKQELYQEGYCSNGND